ncbi:MAG: chitobiase/beta-hexosaminidase C-terminal domain-containing protein [Spirochaetales bacterium]|nr:chitobiase/beta-hexosaminidase C-terminal domain-containing protein [Spirochaetales bacterium]
MKKQRFFSLPALFILLILAACSNPFISNNTVPSVTEVGSLSIQLSDTSRGMHSPDLDMSIAYYKITGSGPSGASFGPMTITGTEATVDDLVLGSWTVTAEAYNTDDFLLGSGSGTGLVASGSPASISITVTPLTEDGGITVNIIWPASFTTSSVSASLTPPGGTAAPASFTISENGGSYSDTSAAEGNHFLIATVSSGAFSHTFLEGIKVVSGYTTMVDLEITPDMAVEDSVSTPAADPSAGTYGSSQSISLSSLPGDAVIYYSLNGSIPDAEHGTEYTGPVTINTGAVLKAAAVSPAGIQSEVLTAEYIIDGTVQRPVVDISQGLYFDPVNIVLSAPGDVTIVYTTDGDDPGPFGPGSFYSDPIPVTADTIIKAIAFDSTDTGNVSDIMTAEYRITDYVEDPVLELAGGTYNEDQTLTITCATADSVIFYTTDGTEPSGENGTPYTGSVTIDRTMTVKAVGTKTDWGESNPFSATYTMALSNVVPSLTSGTFNTPQTVELSSATSGDTIYYTLDGTTPDETSDTYTDPIAIDVSTTLKAVAKRDGWTDSQTLTEDYELKVVTPTLTIPGGTYLENIFTVDFSTTTSGCSLVYTLDGEDPVPGTTGSIGTSRVIADDTTLKIIASKTGWTDSDIVLAVYDVSNPSVSPADQTVTIDTSPEFFWNGAYTIYQIEIAEDSGFTSIKEGPVTVAGTSHITQVLPYPDIYYWRVRPETTPGSWGSWSGPWEIEVNLSPSWTGINPADGGTTFDSTPLLVWDDIPGAVKYSVKIASTEAGLSVAVPVENLQSSEYLYPSELVDEEVVWWVAAAVNDEGDANWGTNNFSFTYQSEASFLNWTPAVSNPLMVSSEVPAAITFVDENYSSGGFRGGTSVMYDGGVYKMWMTGWRTPEKISIGYATSNNGYDWTFVEGTQSGGSVIQNGTSTYYNAFSPSVIKDGSTYKMWYGITNNGFGHYNYASSSDGISWIYHGTVLSYSDGASLGFETTQPGESAAPTVIKESDGTYKMWFVGYAGGILRIGLATSTDGISWTRVSGSGYGGSVLDLGNSSRFDYSQVNHPTVIKEGDIYKMIYFGSNGSLGVSGFGYATSLDGINWEKQYNTENSDGSITEFSSDVPYRYPTIAYDGNEYRLYYSVHRNTSEMYMIECSILD